MSATQTFVDQTCNLPTERFKYIPRMQPKTTRESPNQVESSMRILQENSRKQTQDFIFPTKVAPRSTKLFPRPTKGYLAVRKGAQYEAESPVGMFSAIPRRHKRQKPVSRGSYESSRLCRVHELDMLDPCIKNIPRAGVLFYTFIDEELYICFGRDQATGDLTDFGGGRKQNEDPVRCAIREGNEESRFAFSEIQPEQVQEFFCLYSSNMLIIFIPVAAPDGMDIRQVTNENFSSKQFLNRRQVQAKCYNEVSDLVWLGEAEIGNLFSARPSFQMFAKVRRFIYSCNDFSQNPIQMKRILISIVNETKEPANSNTKFANPQPYTPFPLHNRVPFPYHSGPPGLEGYFSNDLSDQDKSPYLRSSCSPSVIRVDNYTAEATNN